MHSSDLETPPESHAPQRPAPAPRAAPRPARYAAPPTPPRASGSHGVARIPSLDGLRAASILLVIAWHVAPLTPAPGLDQLWRIDAGNLGVRTFFVISGFLITTLLLAESRATGRIDLPRFYLRRTFRIMPAFYVFLAAMAAAAAVGWQALSPASLLRAATFTSNYLTAEWPVGHTWSLSVEEQFYLLWPGLLVLVGLRGGFRVAMAMLVLSPLARVAALSLGHWPANPRYAFETVADALATGCLLARHRDALWARPRYRRLVGGAAGALWPVAVLAVAALSVRWPLAGAAVGVSALNLLLAVGIDRSIRVPGDALGRLLNARPIAFVGTLSYSLYLWQQPLLAESIEMALPLRLAGIACCAALSYYVVERHGLRLRAAVERRLLGRGR